jgi:hypothetical protein
MHAHILLKANTYTFALSTMSGIGNENMEVNLQLDYKGSSEMVATYSRRQCLNDRFLMAVSCPLDTSLPILTGTNSDLIVSHSWHG